MSATTWPNWCATPTTHDAFRGFDGVHADTIEAAANVRAAGFRLQKRTLASTGYIIASRPTAIGAETEPIVVWKVDRRFNGAVCSVNPADATANFHRQCSRRCGAAATAPS